MSYESFKVLKSSAVPLPIGNVDTDQIILQDFLKQQREKDLVKTYLGTGGLLKITELKDFVLNNPIYSEKY